MKNDLSVSDLKFILDLYKTNSLTVTAADFGVSVPTASRIINRLRKTIGDDCFVRSGNTMVATHRIHRLVPKIHEVLRSLQELTEEGVYLPEAIKRRFIVQMVDNAAVSLLMPVLPEIHRQAPNINIQIRAAQGNLYELLRSGKIDLCFGYPPDDSMPSDIRFVKLFDSEHVCIVRQGHPLCREKKIFANQSVRKISPEDLSAYPVTNVSLPQWVGDQDIDVVVKGDLPNAGNWIYTPYFLSIPFFVMESDSYGFLPRETAEYFAKFLPIAILELDSSQVRPWTPHLLWHVSRSGDYQLQWLRTTISDYCQNRVKLDKAQTSQGPIDKDYID